MSLRFVDLFAGIGGFRLALESLGCRCVMSSEINTFARQTYAANFGELPSGDIREITSDEVPDHDILCGGFPCQSFSIQGAGKRRSLGIPNGFDDPKTGFLFFEIVRLLRDKRPAALFLENVPHILYVDGGKVFETIRSTIEGFGYSFSWQVIDASPVVPQRRKRVYMVGFADGSGFEFPALVGSNPTLKDILADDGKSWWPEKDYEYLMARRETRNGASFLRNCHRTPDDVSCTLTATYRHAPIIMEPNKKPRRLTPRECARCQGFPDSFSIPVSRTQAYRQFGNAVCVPVVQAVGRGIVDRLCERVA